MPYTQSELANIANSALEFFFDRPNVAKQNIQNKPLMAAFDQSAGTFSGGNGIISLRIKSGQGGGTLQGYTNDDQVGYYNPTTTRRVTYTWKEHHIGLGITHSELKTDGVTVVEDGASMDTTTKDGREEHVLAELLDNKLEDMDEDYRTSWNLLLWGDGTTDGKALAGIRSIILDDPDAGTTGGFSRVLNPWWRNRAITTASGGAISSNVANGGALLQTLQEEYRQIRRFAQGGVRHRVFAGSDFIGALEKELRANGTYTDRGFRSRETVNGGMDTVDGVPFHNWMIAYDPTLDDLGRSKYCYVIDMRRIRLLYMTGERMKKTSPARPHDRYMIYMGLTTTAAMVAQQLNTSAVYQIA